MIERETGYNADVFCDCKPCIICNGEGETVAVGANDGDEDELITCPFCCDGRDTSMCEVHGSNEPTRKRKAQQLATNILKNNRFLEDLFYGNGRHS